MAGDTDMPVPAWRRHGHGAALTLPGGKKLPGATLPLPIQARKAGGSLPAFPPTSRSDTADDDRRAVRAVESAA